MVTSYKGGGGTPFLARGLSLNLELPGGFIVTHLDVILVAKLVRGWPWA